MSLENTKIGLTKLSDSFSPLDIFKSKNSLDEMSRKIQNLELDLDSLAREKTAYIANQNKSIEENLASIPVVEKKLENMKYDVELANRQLVESLAELEATGDSRIRSTFSNAQSMLLDMRDAQSFYKKLLSIDSQSDANFLQLGSSQLRSDAVFNYTSFAERVIKMDTLVATFDPKKATLDEAKILAEVIGDTAKLNIDFNAGIKNMIESTLV